MAVGLDGLRIEIHRDLTCADNRLSVSFGPPHDRVDACHQLFPIERFRQVVIRAATEPLDLVIGTVHPRKDQGRCIDPAHPQLSEHFVPVDVRQRKVEDQKIVVVQLRQLDPFLTRIGDVGIQVRFLEHQFNALGG